MRVKICGITRAEDALFAVERGAWAVGVVVCSDSSRQVSLNVAKEIFHAIEGESLAVAVSHTSRPEDLKEILALCPDAVQLSHPHRLEDEDVLVFRVVKRSDSVPDHCDAVVLDESMGRGRIFDAENARELIRRSRVPVILAGGLDPVNVRDVIRSLRPYAVDVATGVEISPGIKDRRKMEAFLEACRVGAA